MYCLTKDTSLQAMLSQILAMSPAQIDGLPASDRDAFMKLVGNFFGDDLRLLTPFQRTQFASGGLKL